MRNKMSLISAFAACLCLSLHSCGKDDADVKYDGDYPATHQVFTKYSRTSMLRNPLNGWVMYGSRDASASYWDTEHYVLDVGKEVRMRDYASACYIRTSWASLNPSDGVYIWNDPSSRLCQLIRGAEERGLPIAFRIVVDGRDQGLNTPQFVFDAGAGYWVSDPSHPTWLTPYPQDPVFRQYYAKFIEAFAAEFNDPDRTAFIDAYGLGKWGEAHNTIYESVGERTTENTEALKAETFKWVTDLYTRCFTKVPLVINYHRHVGHPISWSETPTASSAALLEEAINKGYSLRHDAFGMTGYYKVWEKNFAATWNYRRPIIMEGGWITGGTHRYWTDPCGKYIEGKPETVRQGEFEGAAEAKANMMDFRAGYDGETWFTRSFNLMQRFISEGGYRLYPDQLHIPLEFKSGVEIKITHRWRNMGWGYFPNNIPQWNYKYKVALALLDSNDNAVKVFIDDACEPSEWLKDNIYEYELITKADIPAGNYTWAVAIINTQKNNTPGIQLAVQNEKTADGWVKLREVRVK